LVLVQNISDTSHNNAASERERKTPKIKEKSHSNEKRGGKNGFHAHVAQYHTLVTCICSIPIWLLGYCEIDFSS